MAHYLLHVAHGNRRHFGLGALKVFAALTFVLALPSCSSRLALEGTRENKLKFVRAERPQRLEISSQALGQSDSSVHPSSMEVVDVFAQPEKFQTESSGDVAATRCETSFALPEVESVVSGTSHTEMDEVLLRGHAYGMSFNERTTISEWKKSAIEHGIDKATGVTESSGQDGGGKGLVTAGIVILILGFLLFLFVSWIIGLILMLLGAGLWIAGANGNKSSSGSSSSKTKSEDQSGWQDVVYLKNGSIIKGLIIEQVPNESLKIQTADGSVFVHTMDQVLKITKEPKK